MTTPEPPPRRDRVDPELMAAYAQRVRVQRRLLAAAALTLLGALVLGYVATVTGLPDWAYVLLVIAFLLTATRRAMAPVTTYVREQNARRRGEDHGP